MQPVSTEAPEDNDPVLAAVRHLNRDHALILIGGKSRILWETDTDDAGFRLLEIKAFHKLHTAELDPQRGQAEVGNPGVVSTC